MSTVITQLRELLGTGPQNDSGPDELRRLQIGIRLDALATRGIDGASLVRYGLTFDVCARVVFQLAMSRTQKESHSAALHEEGWSQALAETVSQPALYELEVDATSSSADAQPGVTKIAADITLLTRWAYEAPFDDLLALRPPSRESLLQMYAEPEPDPDVLDAYGWIRDYFSQPELSHWVYRSVHLEYGRQRGFFSAPCRVDPADDRAINPLELATIIADRATQGERTAEGRWPGLMVELRRQAQTMLRAGRYRDAAALFEFVNVHAEDDGGQAANDHGFCLIPIDTRAALHSLEKAHRMGYEPRAINAYNRMCALWAQGEFTAARMIADQYWTDGFEPWPAPAALWIRADDGILALANSPDARLAVAELAVEISRAEGWPDRLMRWELRHNEFLRGHRVM